MAYINPYAARLKDYSSFSFEMHEAPADKSELRGKWREFFLSRTSRKPESIILEIGCSNAFFLSDVAKRNPGSGFIGIDWKFKVLFNGAKKIEREGIKNVALIRGRVQELLGHFGDGELDEVWIFFPDPWAKKSQLKNRIFNENFLLELARILRKGGKLHFKTDHPGYFQWCLALMGQPLPEMHDRYSEAAAAAASSKEMNRKLKQVKVRKHQDAETMPAKSEALAGAYRFGQSTIDYWGEKIKAGAAFDGHTTLFEALFIKDDLPIYYLELAKL